MTLDQFFSDAIELFDIYLKAYRDDINEKAWLNGLYNTKAFESALANIGPYAISKALNGGKAETIYYLDKPIDLEKEQESASTYNQLTPKDMIMIENEAMSIFK